MTESLIFRIRIDQNQKIGERAQREAECFFHCCSILNDLFIQQNNPKYGGVAQLGEHLPCKQGVMGSIPIISTRRKFRQPRSTSRVRTKCSGMLIEERFERTRYTETYMGS